ncbi:MAG: PHP domain-containing protein [Phascolarctobacterium faecium]
MRGDLHLHSVYSDGSATVIELIQQAVSKGLTVIAITDHDLRAALGDIPPVTALKVMPGIEISAMIFKSSGRRIF